MKLTSTTKLLCVFVSITAASCRVKRRAQAVHPNARGNNAQQQVSDHENQPPSSERAIHTLENSLTFSESNEDDFRIEANVDAANNSSITSIDLNCLNATQKKRERSKINDQKSVVDEDKWANMLVKADRHNFFSHFGFAVDRPNDSNYQCAICLETFKKNDFIFAMHPEKLLFDVVHVFHVSCVENLSQKSCPLCKKGVFYRMELVECAKHHNIPSTIEGFSYLENVPKDKVAKYAEYVATLIDREIDDSLVKQKYLSFMFYAAITQKLSIEIFKAAPKILLSDEFENLVEIYESNFDKSPLNLLLRLHETKCINKKMARQIAKSLIKSASKFDAFYYEVINFLNFCHAIFSPSKNFSYLRLITKHFYGLDYGNFTLHQINEGTSYAETLLLGCCKGTPVVIYDALFPFIRYAREQTLNGIANRILNRADYDKRRILPIVHHILTMSVNDDLKLTIIVKLCSILSGESISDVVEQMEIEYQLKFHNYCCSVDKFMLVLEDVRKRVGLVENRKSYQNALQSCIEFKDAKLLDALLHVEKYGSDSFLFEIFGEFVDNFTPDMRSEIMLTILKDKAGVVITNNVMRTNFLNRTLSKHLLEEALKSFQSGNAHDSSMLLLYLKGIFENMAIKKTPYPIPTSAIPALVRKLNKEDYNELIKLPALQKQSVEVIQMIEHPEN